MNLQPGDDDDGGNEHQQRQHADVDASDLEGHYLEAAGVEFAAIGGEHLEEAVLEDHREAESDQQRRQDVFAEGVIEDQPLQPVADRRHQRNDQDQRGQRVQTARADDHESDVGGEHDHVAMGDIDEPHDPEDQRQSGREQRVEAADQHALNDRVQPIHAAAPATCRQKSTAPK